MKKCVTSFVAWLLLVLSFSRTFAWECEGDVSGHFEVWKIIGINISEKKILYIGKNGIVYAQHFDVKKIFKIILRTHEVIDGREIENVVYYSVQRHQFVDYFFIRRGGSIEANDIEWIVFN